MSEAKIFTVFGATGNQGSSVINELLTHPYLSKEYKLRGVTRNTSSDKAKALTQKGVEMVVGDLENYDSVSEAIKGSYGVFAVTNYWEMPSKEREVNQGKRIADACKEHGVKQLVWSSLVHVEKLSGGKYPNVAHFDGKAEIAEYIASIGVPHICVIAGVFMTNLTEFIIRKNDDGNYTFGLPLPSDVKYPWFNPSVDTGNFVAGALQQELLHQNVFHPTNPTIISEATDFISGDEVCQQFHAITGKNISYFQIPEDNYKANFPTPELGQELLENWWLIRDYGYFGPDVEKSIQGVDESIKKFTVRKPYTLADFIKKHEW